MNNSQTAVKSFIHLSAGVASIRVQCVGPSTCIDVPLQAIGSDLWVFVFRASSQYF